VRDIVHPSLGGSALRVEVTNRFGVAPLAVDEVTVGAPMPDGGVVPGSLRVATFGHHLGTLMPPGADVASDPVPLATHAGRDVSVSIAVRSDAGGATGNFNSQQYSYAGPGNEANELTATGLQGIFNWAWLRALEVLHPAPAHTVVAFGDSLTSGYDSTANANARWPDRLADLLNARPANGAALANAGIAGNLLLTDAGSPSGLSRFGADVLARTGVRTVVVLIGVNDLDNDAAAPPVDAAQLEAGYGQLIGAAHRAGVRVLGGTLLPYRGATTWTAAREAQRQALNLWIRSSGQFDLAVDLASVVADPSASDRLQARFDGGDHIHLNDVGYAAIARAIPILAL
jgi:lysophospholipase L1-like esterase